MDPLFHQRLDALVQDLQVKLHQAFDQQMAEPSLQGLWQMEHLLWGLLMSLGSALIALYLDAWHHHQQAWIGRIQRTIQARGYRLAGWRLTPITTLFGGKHRIATPYAVVDRRGRPGRRRKKGKRGPKGGGCFPVLEALGCREKATPALLSEVASQLAWGPSEAAAVERLQARGIPLDHQAVRRLSYALADEGLQRRQQALAQGQPAPGSEDLDLTGKRVVITVDGGRIRIREPRKGRRQANGHHGFDPVWRTPRLLVIYIIDEKGRLSQQECPLYDGVLTSASQLFELLTNHLKALHLEKAQQVIFVADGEDDNWNALPALRRQLGLTDEQVVEVLDWAHALGRLSEAADACQGWSAHQRRHWLQIQRQRLKQGQVEELVEELESLARGRRAKSLRKIITYFQQHTHRMRYRLFRQAHIPLGSGAVESALRRVVNLRMKGAGIFWLSDHSKRMLFLRCQLLSGRWDRFIQALLWSAAEETENNTAAESAYAEVA
jgi:hypothetical protein